MSPAVIVPVRLTVEGRPEILVVPQRLDFGAVFVGANTRLSLQIANTGSTFLHVSAIVSDADSIAPAPSSVDVFPGEVESVDVVFAPAAVGAVGGALVVFLRADPPACGAGRDLRVADRDEGV